MTFCQELKYSLGRFKIIGFMVFVLIKIHEIHILLKKNQSAKLKVSIGQIVVLNIVFLHGNHIVQAHHNRVEGLKPSTRCYHLNHCKSISYCGWCMTSSSFSFGKCRYNGRTDWADWADTNGFLGAMAPISSKKSKKNRFQSAQSAQSVLPLYRHFPNEKLLHDIPAVSHLEKSGTMSHSIPKPISVVYILF